MVFLFYVNLKITRFRLEILSQDHCWFRECVQMEGQRTNLEKVVGSQKKIIIDFMETHSEFAKCKLLGSEGRKAYKLLWDELVAQLNSCKDGPTKSVAKWQRVWTDMKNKIKKKVTAMQETGADPALHNALSEIEKRLINILTEKGVYGSDTVKEDIELGTTDVTTVFLEKGVCGTNTFKEDIELGTTDITAVFLEKAHYSPTMSFKSLSPASSSDHYLMVSPDGSPIPVKRRREESPTLAAREDSQILEEFTNIGRALNKEMANVSNKLDLLIEEKRQSNKIMQQILEVLAKNK